MSGKYATKIRESEEELQILLSQQTRPVNQKKIQVLYLYKTNQVTTITNLAQLINKNRSTIYRWLKIYQEQGIDALLAIKPHQGRPQRIPQNVIDILSERLQHPNNGFSSYGDILNWLAQEYNLRVDYNTVYSLINYKLKIKVIWSPNAHRRV